MSYKDEYDFDDGDAYDFGGGGDTYGYSAPPREDAVPFQSSHQGAGTKYPDSEVRSNEEREPERETVPSKGTIAPREEAPGDDVEVSEPQEPIIQRPKHVLGYTVEDCGGASIESTWKGERRTESFSCQTTPVEIRDQDTSTGTRTFKSTQTESDFDGVDLGQVCDGFAGWDPKADGLCEFIRSAGLSMMEELEKSEESHAFDDFDTMGLDDGEVLCSEILSTPTMRDVPIQKFGHGGEEQTEVVDQSVTSISWNATGSIVVVGYGQRCHYGWSSGAKAGCSVWNIFARDFQADKPKLFLETSSCVMSVACHPELPALVAAGTFNGEVYVWDTSIDDERPMQIAATRIDDYFHREAVISVKWVYDERETAHYLLVTESGEGKVLFWSLKNDLACPVGGYLLQTKRKTGRGRSEKAIVGGTSMSFQSGGDMQVGTDEAGKPIVKKVKYSTSFVVGSEGGQIFRCFLRQRGSGRRQLGPKWTGEAEELLSRVSSEFRRDIQRHVEAYVQDLGGNQTVTLQSIYDSRPPPAQLFPSPIDMAYEPHTGPVHEIACSPHHRNMFISCGADGNANIYSVLQKQSLVTLDPSTSYLMSAAWSNVRPMVFAVGSEDGSIFVYDLSRSATSPIFSLPSATKKSVSVPSVSSSSGSRVSREANPCLTTLAFDPRVGTLFASGDETGNVRIWKLSPAFSTSLANEQGRLNQFYNGYEDEEEKAAQAAKDAKRRTSRKKAGGSGKK